jgi:hypothetical protein
MTGALEAITPPVHDNDAEMNQQDSMTDLTQLFSTGRSIFLARHAILLEVLLASFFCQPFPIAFP